MAAEHIGKEIVIATDEGKFYGTIHSIDVPNRKLILQKVSTSKGTKMRGLQIFFTNEMRDLQLLEDDQNEEKRSNGGEREIATYSKELEAEAMEQDDALTAKDPSDEGSRLIARKPLVPNKFLAGDEGFITTTKEDQLSNPPDITFIDEFGGKFDEALEIINSQRVVGLSAEGDKIGRSGVLCFLVVGCRQVTYVFDIYRLGEECFSNGLQAFLEDCYILKVIHDCRLLSDCLFHKYDISLKNIFDTQVADIIIYKQKRGRLPRDVNGLEACLYEYLQLQPSKCKFLSVIYQSVKADANLWTKRPLPTKVLNAIAEKVLYLRELRITQMENMLAEFLFGVDVYLEIFRDSNTDYSGSMAKTVKVPAPFYHLKNVTEKRWRSYEERDKMAASVVETFPGDEKKVGSNPEHNVGWTEGNVFTEVYSKKHGRILERDDLDKKVSAIKIDDDNGGPVIDTRTAPWRSTGLSGAKNGGNDTLSAEIIFKSESSVREPRKKRRGQLAGNDRAAKKEHDSISAFPNNKLKQQNLQNTGTTTMSPGITLKENGQQEHHVTSEEIEPKMYQNLLPSQSMCVNNNTIEQKIKQKVEEERKDKSKENTLRFPHERKVPIDWFDYDSPSSGRSRASSANSEASASSSQRDHWQQVQYEEEFPVLSPKSQSSTPEKGYSPQNESRNKAKSIAVGAAKKNLNGMLGVNGTSAKARPVGRAKSREYFAASRSPLAGSPLIDEIPRLISVGGKNSHEFPSDADLLQTNPIIKASYGSPVLGQKMTIHKVTPK